MQLIRADIDDKRYIKDKEFTLRVTSSLPLRDPTILNGWSWSNLSRGQEVSGLDNPSVLSFRKEILMSKFVVPLTLGTTQTWYSFANPTSSENDFAAQLVGFMQQFLEVFPGTKAKKLYPMSEV